MSEKGSYLTKRDLKILKMCLEQKFMTLKQVGRMYFRESQNVQKVPLRRLNILMRHGLLKSVRPVVGGEAIYLTTEKGVKLLQKHNLSENLRALPGIDYKTFEHDRLVTDVGIVFKSRSRYKWVSERKLRQEKPKSKVPDAVLFHDGYKFIIEVERTLKKNSYYERIFESLSCDYPDVEAFLYLTDGLPMTLHLQKLADGWKRIYFASLKDFLKYEYCTEFYNYKDDCLMLEGYWITHPNGENILEYSDYPSVNVEKELQEKGRV